MLSGALLAIMEEAGMAVLTMTEGLEQEEFFATRLTRQEVLRQMQIMADTAGNMPDEIRAILSEIDWQGWTALGLQLKIPDGCDRDALWFGVRSLVPAMLMWLRVYRQNQPEVFAFTV